MPVDHSAITDSRGRHIPVVRRRIERAGVVETTPAHDGPRNGRELGERLDRVVARLRRLAPSDRWPERFHEERSDIEHEIARLAAWAHRQKD